MRIPPRSAHVPLRRGPRTGRRAASLQCPCAVRHVRQAAWYAKELPTLADALALVCRQLWPVPVFSTSPVATGMVEISRALLARLTDTLAYAA
ncbi:MAG: hypothetical protein NTZ05_02925 [Chloroflexi bacterium]|nr:hypothetical protein [Chloroflexota bacterium]